MDILNQIRVPYDGTALSILEKVQSQPMRLKDFTRENCLKLRTIIKETTDEEVRGAAVDVQTFVKKQFELQRHSLRQKTMTELRQRYSNIQQPVQVLENAFYHTFTSSTSDFADKSDIYASRCIDVIGSILPKIALLDSGASLESIKELVTTAIKSWDENAATSPSGTKRPRDDEVFSTADISRKRVNSIDASVPETEHLCSPSTMSRTPGPPTVNGETAACRVNGFPRPASSTLPDPMVPTPVMDSSSDSSSSDSEDSVVSETSTYESDKELEKKFREKKRRRLPARTVDPEAIERRKKFAAQRQNDRIKERTLKAEARQEAKRIKREEKERRKAEKKLIRDAEKKLKREKKKQEEEEKKAREEKERALWGSWMSSRFPGSDSHDAKFTAAWAKAHARMQNESPRPPTYVTESEKRTGGRSSPSRAAPTSHRTSHAERCSIPASVPHGGVVPSESVMGMVQRLEKIVPYIHSYRGALRFLGATNVEEAKKNYKKMLLHVHTDKLGPDATHDAKKRACGLMDALNKSRAKVMECSNEATVDRIDPPRKVSSKVDHLEVKIWWEASAGAARYEVQVFDPKSDRYHTLVVCEPEFDATANRYKTIEECTTTNLSPGKCPKLVHLWHNETMQVQVTAVSQKGTRSAPASIEIPLSRAPAGASLRSTPSVKHTTASTSVGRPVGFTPRHAAWATDPGKVPPNMPRSAFAPRSRTTRPPGRSAHTMPSAPRPAAGDMPSASRSSTDAAPSAPRAAENLPSTPRPNIASAPQCSVEGQSIPVSPKLGATETTRAPDRPTSAAGPVPALPLSCRESATPQLGRPPSTGPTASASRRPCREETRPKPGRPPTTGPTVPASSRPSHATLSTGVPPVVSAAVRAKARPLCPPKPSIVVDNSGLTSPTPSPTGLRKAWSKWAARVASPPVTKED